MNMRAGLNNNAYGRFLPSVCGFTPVRALTPALPRLPADGSQSGAQYPPRAAEAVWPQWQSQQQAQNNAEQQPHPQGNQQDMFPVSDAAFRMGPNRLCSYVCPSN